MRTVQGQLEGGVRGGGLVLEEEGEEGSKDPRLGPRLGLSGRCGPPQSSSPGPGVRGPGGAAEGEHRGQKMPRPECKRTRSPASVSRSAHTRALEVPFEVERVASPAPALTSSSSRARSNRSHPLGPAPPPQSLPVRIPPTPTRH